MNFNKTNLKSFRNIIMIADRIIYPFLNTFYLSLLLFLQSYLEGKCQNKIGWK